jgi:adenylate kinase family enzyme
MSSRKWLDNAFWEAPETKDDVTCILQIIDDNDRKVEQVMRLKKFTKSGNENTDFAELIEVLGEDLITKNTEQRLKRKAAEKEEKRVRDIEHEKARALEKLFGYKMEAFEVEEIKKCKNRKLKAKLRRAKSKIEVNLYSMMILQEHIANEEKENAEEETEK